MSTLEALNRSRSAVEHVCIFAETFSLEINAAVLKCRGSSIAKDIESKSMVF